MTTYELRIWPNPHSRSSHPLRVETFEADTNTDAIAYMRRFAETELPASEQMFLWAQGGGRSIASDAGQVGQAVPR